MMVVHQQSIQTLYLSHSFSPSVSLPQSLSLSSSPPPPSSSSSPLTTSQSIYYHNQSTIRFILLGGGQQTVGETEDDNKCKRGQVHHFERAIILLRDPFDSIWSEYQRRVSKSHVQGIPKRGFNWHRWQANAAALGNSYFRTWEYEHSGIERELKPEDYIYLKYEDLKDKQKRVSVLKDILKFLRYDEHAANDERIECAFILAENRQAHRSVDKSLVMTKEEAYIPEIACRMWALFGHYASKHGYKPWANYDCTGYPKIPRINVGSNGEYDRAWVSAGDKLIDFRLPETIAKHRNQTLLEGFSDEGSFSDGGPFDEIRKRNKRLQRQQRRQQRPPGGPIQISQCCLVYIV